MPNSQLASSNDDESQRRAVVFSDVLSTVKQDTVKRKKTVEKEKRQRNDHFTRTSRFI